MYHCCVQCVEKLLVVITRNQTTERKVSCHFINIHQSNKWVSAVYAYEKSSRPEKDGNQWLYGHSCLGWGKVDTTHCYHGNTERTAVPQSN